MAAKLPAMGYEAWFYEPAAGGHGYGKDNRERAGFIALGYTFLRNKIGWADNAAWCFATPPRENALSRPLLARSPFGSHRTGLVDLRTRIDEAGVRETWTPIKRDRGGEAEEAGAAHAKLRGALVDPRNQALRQIDVDPFGRIGRIDPDNEIGDDLGALGQRDLLDRRRLRQRPALLCHTIHRSRQRSLRFLDRLLLRPPAGNAARKIGKPRAERTARAALQHGRIEPLFQSGLLTTIMLFNTHSSASNH